MKQLQASNTIFYDCIGLHEFATKRCSIHEVCSFFIPISCVPCFCSLFLVSRLSMWSAHSNWLILYPSRFRAGSSKACVIRSSQGKDLLVLEINNPLAHMLLALCEECICLGEIQSFTMHLRSAPKCLCLFQKTHFFQGNPCKNFQFGFFFWRNFLCCSLVPGNPHPPAADYCRPLSTRANESRQGPTRADHKTKMADDRRCLVATTYRLVDLRWTAGLPSNASQGFQPTLKQCYASHQRFFSHTSIDLSALLDIPPRTFFKGRQIFFFY